MQDEPVLREGGGGGGTSKEHMGTCNLCEIAYPGSLVLIREQARLHCPSPGSGTESAAFQVFLRLRGIPPNATRLRGPTAVIEIGD